MVQQHMSIIPALRKRRRVDVVFEASLGYGVVLCLTKQNKNSSNNNNFKLNENKSLSVVFKFFTFLARLIYYVYEHFDCMDACVPCVNLVPEKVIRESLRSSKTKCGCWKPDTSPLKEQQAEPSLQPSAQGAAQLPAVLKILGQLHSDYSMWGGAWLSELLKTLPGLGRQRKQGESCSPSPPP